VRFQLRTWLSEDDIRPILQGYKLGFLDPHAYAVIVDAWVATSAIAPQPLMNGWKDPPAGWSCEAEIEAILARAGLHWLPAENIVAALSLTMNAVHLAGLAYEQSKLSRDLEVVARGVVPIH
jgi:hypothetical protein